MRKSVLLFVASIMLLSSLLAGCPPPRRGHVPRPRRLPILRPR